MKYRKPARSNLKCSEISLGTWAFASQVYGNVSEKEAHSAVSAAIELGINLFDTAPLYGDSERNGIAEEILGRALGKKRDDVLISTKFGRYATDGGAANFHAARARESVEGSLSRLKTDHIDILFFHSPFGAQDIHDDVWEELGKLNSEGKIRYIGHSISMFDETKGMAREWADQRKIDFVQVVYSMMNRQAGTLINELSESGVGIIARECLANGFLSGKITRNTVFPENNLNNRYTREQIVERVDYVASLDFLVREQIRTVPQSAMRWVLDNEAVTSVLAGCRNSKEILDCAAASDADPYRTEEYQRATSLHKKDFPGA